MAIYQLYKELPLSATVEEAWEFISNPSNLAKITPDYMGFDIRTPRLPEKIYPGLIIAYRVRPLMGIPMTWLTEITQVSEKSYFVDEQRRGPYALWHHEHWVIPVESGVLMKDLVTYVLPAGSLGDMAQRMFVKKQLEGIFQYREQALVQIFGRP
jgi:ligand-binding SRPBCC domain-containing protein